jgi:DUF177 domain-containing protein
VSAFTTVHKVSVAWFTATVSRRGFSGAFAVSWRRSSGIDGERIMTWAETRQAPVRFDAFKLATGGDVLSGRVNARQFQRVADRMADAPQDASVAWRIEGGLDASGRPALTVCVDGVVPLICQRCLEPFAWKVEQHTVLLLAHNESELASLDTEELEVVLASEALDALTLVEDELLLSLPFSPRHPEGACGSDMAATIAEPQKASPFARLGALKSGHD